MRYTPETAMWKIAGFGFLWLGSGLVTLYAAVRKRRPNEVAKAVVKRVTGAGDSIVVVLECDDTAGQRREVTFRTSAYSVPVVGEEIEVRRPRPSEFKTESISRARLRAVAFGQLAIAAAFFAVAALAWSQIRK